MAGVRLTQPYPTTYQSKGKGSQKIVQTYGVTPPSGYGVGFGQDDGEDSGDYPDESSRAPFQVAPSMPVRSAREGATPLNALQQMAGAAMQPNTLNQLWKRDIPSMAFPSLQSVTAPIGENLNALTGGRFGQATGAIGNINLQDVAGKAAGFGLAGPVRPQDVQGMPGGQTTLGDVASTAAGFVAPGPGHAPLGAESTAAGRAQEATTALQRAGVPPIAGAARAPRVDRSAEYAAQQAASQLPLTDLLGKSTELAQKGARGGSPKTAADVEALQRVANVSEAAKASAKADVETAAAGGAGKPPRPPRKPRAGATAEAPVPGDNDQATIDAWGKMVNEIDAKREADALEKARQVGVDVKPKAKPKAKPPSGTIPPLTKAALGSAGDLPPSEAESVMRGLWHLFAQPSSVPGVTVGAYQAKNDWDQHAKDNIAARTWSALVAGTIGFGFGSAVGHIAFGGPASGLAKRGSNFMVSNLFGPATVAKKVLGDIGNITMSVPAQRYLSTVLDGRPQDIIPAVKAGWQGFGPALLKAKAAGSVAFDPNEIRSVQKGLEGIGKTLSEETPSAGQFMGSMYTRGMQYATDFAKVLTEERSSAQNAVETQRQMNGFLEKAKPEDVTKWLNETVKEDGVEVPRIDSEQFKAGLPGDALLRLLQDSVGGFKEGSYGYEMARAVYARDKAESWAAEHLLAPDEWAKRSTFTNDPSGIVGKVTQAVLKAPGDMVQGLVDIARGTTKADKMAREFPTAIQRVFSPVSRIPANLMDEFVARIPGLGLANALPVLSKGTRAEKNLVLAKQVMGATELAAGWALANYVIGPNVNGQGPISDPKKYKEWLADGNVPWSIRWPDGRWRPIHEIPHPGAQTMARAIATVSDHAKFGTPYDPGSMATDLGSSIADSSYMPTMLDAARAMQTYQITKKWSDALGSFGWDIGTGMARAIPSQNERMLAQSGRTTQPEIFGAGVPKEESLRREVATGFPESTGSVPAAVNATGQPRPNFQQGAYAPMGAMAGSQPMNDPVLNFLQQNGVAPNLAAKSIEYGLGPDKKPMTLPLSGEQQKAFTKAYGDTLRQQIASLEKDPRWQNATPAQRQQFINHPTKGLLEFARKRAQQTVIQQMGGPQAILGHMNPAEAQKFATWERKQPQLR